MGDNKLNNLIGCQVSFGVSDPWDFGSKYGEGPFSAIVEDVYDNMLLCKLSQPMEYENSFFDSLVVVERHVNKDFRAIFNNETIPVNLIPVCKEVVLQPNVVKNMETANVNFQRAASWRGWHLIGGVCLKRTKGVKRSNDLFIKHKKNRQEK